MIITISIFALLFYSFMPIIFILSGGFLTFLVVSAFFGQKYNGRTEIDKFEGAFSGIILIYSTISGAVLGWIICIILFGLPSLVSPLLLISLGVGIFFLLNLLR